AKTQRHCRPTEGQAEEPQHKNRRWESRDDRKQREERGGDSQGRDAQPERRDNAPPSLLLPLENISLLFAGGRPGRIPHRSPLALPRPSIEAAPQSIRSRWPPAAEPSRGRTLGQSSAPPPKAFVGAFARNQANQGAIITTSGFSSEAASYAEQVPTRILLIDGHRRTRLMVRYGLGIQVERTVHVVEDDEVFFEGLWVTCHIQHVTSVMRTRKSAHIYVDVNVALLMGLLTSWIYVPRLENKPLIEIANAADIPPLLLYLWITARQDMQLAWDI